MGDSPWGHKESDMTEHAHTHTHTSKSTPTLTQRLGDRGAMSLDVYISKRWLPSLREKRDLSESYEEKI